jgi:large subunit ribosomal protein L15
MRLNTIKPGAGSKRTRLRVGRGASAGQGKTCGRGVKGADVTLAGLIEANLVPENTKLVKIILSGKLTKAFAIKDKAITATKGAKSAVESAGGKFEA